MKKFTIAVIAISVIAVAIACNSAVVAHAEGRTNMENAELVVEEIIDGQNLPDEDIPLAGPTTSELESEEGVEVEVAEVAEEAAEEAESEIEEIEEAEVEEAAASTSETAVMEPAAIAAPVTVEPAPIAQPAPEPTPVVVEEPAPAPQPEPVPEPTPENVIVVVDGNGATSSLELSDLSDSYC